MFGSSFGSRGFTGRRMGGGNTRPLCLNLLEMTGPGAANSSIQMDRGGLGASTSTGPSSSTTVGATRSRGAAPGGASRGSRASDTNTNADARETSSGAADQQRRYGSESSSGSGNGWGMRLSGSLRPSYVDGVVSFPGYAGPTDPPRHLTHLLKRLRDTGRMDGGVLAERLLMERREASSPIHPINYSAGIDLCLRLRDRPRAARIFDMMCEDGHHWEPAYAAMIHRGTETPAEVLALVRRYEAGTRGPATLKILVAAADAVADQGELDLTLSIIGRVQAGDYATVQAPEGFGPDADGTPFPPATPPIPATSSSGSLSGAAPLSPSEQARSGRRTARRRDAFDGPSELVNFNIMLKAALRSGDTLAVIAMWDEMRKDNVEPDIISYNILAEAYPSAYRGDDRAERSEWLLDEMQGKAAARSDPGLLPDATTYTSLLKGLGAAASAARARVARVAGPSALDRFLDRVAREITEGYRVPGGAGRSRGPYPPLAAPPCVDLTLRSALVEAFCDLDRADEALAWINRFRDAGDPPRKHAYLTLASHYARQGKAFLVEHLLGRLEQGEHLGRPLLAGEAAEVRRLVAPTARDSRGAAAHAAGASGERRRPSSPGPLPAGSAGRQGDQGRSNPAPARPATRERSSWDRSDRTDGRGEAVFGWES